MSLTADNRDRNDASQSAPAATTPNPTQSNDRFRVHNYTAASSEASRGGSSQLLETAQSLINASSSRHMQGWTSMKEAEGVAWIPGKLYMYYASPPLIAAEDHLEPVAELKEWGSVIEDSEVWPLAELDEFDSTDFTVNGQNEDGPKHSTPLSAIVSQRNSMKRPSSQKEPDSSGKDDSVISTKRRKLDESPLYDLLPRPHIYTSLMVDPTKKTAALPSYSRTKPIILPPYTDPLPPPGPYERRAWIIPVRGILPWDRSTPAELLDEREMTPPVRPIPPATRSLEPVVWTRAALVEFWQYLKMLRDEGKVGNLAIAFHGNPDKRMRSRGSGDISEQCGQDPWAFLDEDDSLGVAGGMDVSKAASETPRTLKSVDYIKVHHDAAKSMIVRTALDVWAYKIKGERLRMLKWAKLVLVDHLSKGVLIS